jgi:predicted transcriptional regulator
MTHTDLVADLREARQLEYLGINRERIAILNALLRDGILSTTDVVNRVGGQFNGVWRLLMRLERAGLVSREHATHPRGIGRITYWRPDSNAVHEMIDRLADELFAGAPLPPHAA